MRNYHLIGIVIGYIVLLALLAGIMFIVSEPTPAHGQEVCETTSTATSTAEKVLSVEEKVSLKAKEAGLNESKMLAIAKAESRFLNQPNYKYSGEGGKYTAFGIFQITRTTYKAYCGDPLERFDIDKNIDCAMVIASSSGLHHWDESAYAWKK